MANELKYNIVTRDQEPRSYNLIDTRDKSYQFYFRFKEPVMMPDGKERERLGLTVREEYIDDIPEGESVLETAKAIKSYLETRYLYNGSRQNIESVVAYLEKHDYEDCRLALLDEIKILENKLAKKRKEYEANYDN